MGFDSEVMGARIRKFREDKHYDERREVTQEEVANACDVCVAAYANWERGVSVPSFGNAWALADYFGVTLDELGGRCFEDRRQGCAF